MMKFIRPQGVLRVSEWCLYSLPMLSINDEVWIHFFVRGGGKTSRKINVGNKWIIYMKHFIAHCLQQSKQVLITKLHVESEINFRRKPLRKNLLVFVARNRREGKKNCLRLWWIIKRSSLSQAVNFDLNRSLTLYLFNFRVKNFNSVESFY